MRRQDRLLAAACDHHLPNMILSTAPGPDAPPVAVRVIELREARDDMWCSCGVPAQWMIRSWVEHTDEAAE